MKKNLLSVAILILGIAVSSCTDKLQEAPNMPLNPNLKSESGFQASLNLEKSFISTRSSESTPIYPDYYGGGYIEMFSSAEHALKALGASLSWVK